MNSLSIIRNWSSEANSAGSDGDSPVEMILKSSKSSRIEKYVDDLIRHPTTLTTAVFLNSVLLL